MFRPLSANAGKGYRILPSRLFWACNALAVVGAVIVRLAAPATVLTPLQVLRAGTLAPTNVCAEVDERLLGIARTPTADLPTLRTRIGSLDAYLRSVLFRIPRQPELFPPEFIDNLKALQTLCADADDDTDYEELRISLLTQRTRFRVIERRLPRVLPPHYIQAVRVATGLLEGLSSPALLLWRTARQFLAPPPAARTCAYAAAARAVLNPADWRRQGLPFALALFYGSLLAIYGCAWLAQRFNTLAWAAPGLLALVYGLGHLVLALTPPLVAALGWLASWAERLFALLPFAAMAFIAHLPTLF